MVESGNRPLEHELQAEINGSTASIELRRVQEVWIGDTGVTGGINGGIIDADDGKHAGIGEAELPVIKDVEELRAELHVSPLSDVEALEEAHIKVGAAGSGQGIAAHVAQ